MESYKIYALAECPYCIRLLEALRKKQLTFYVEFLDGRPEKLNEMKELYKHPTVPIVILEKNGKEILIGGCDDAIQSLQKEK